MQDRGSIGFGQSKHSPIATGEYHGYSFSALPGACVDIDLRADVPKQPDTYLFLVNADESWEVVAEDDDSGAALDASIRGLILPHGGDYQIVATSFEHEGDGSYSVTLNCCNGACEPAPEACTGGVDEDADGLIDCADPDCSGDPACVDEELCDNGVDDDRNDLTDCWDVSSCWNAPACAGLPGRLAAGWETTVGIHDAGSHVTTQWGDFGYLPGYGASIPDSSTPIIVPQVEGASNIAADRQIGCAVVGEGRVYCWGFSSGSRYALGLGGVWDDWNRIYEDPPVHLSHVYAGYVRWATINETEDYNEPDAYTHHGELEHVRQVDAGGSHTCAVHEGGEVFCWGRNTYGQIGPIESFYAKAKTYSYATSHALVVPGISDAVQVSTGERHTCARLGDGTVRCWGDNEYGQLGNGTRFNKRAEPQPVMGLTDATHVAAGTNQTCAVHDGGKVSCWGEVHHDLSPGEPRSQVTPHRVTAVLGDMEHVDTEYGITCAVGGGALTCWALDDALLGQDGSPSLVAGIEDAVEVAVGTGHVCVRRSSGTFMCQGHNGRGQLGDGTKSYRQTPVPVITNPI